MFLSSKLLCRQEEGGVQLKIEYHVHLEERPYSANWIGRTANALEFFMKDKTYSYKWMQSLMTKLNKRVKEEEYSEYWLDLYLERAKQLGIKEVGIVDKGYILALLITT